METVEQIQHALLSLTVGERLDIGRWLEEVHSLGRSRYAVAEPAFAQTAADLPFMTLEEFFELEEHSEIRHEYVDGAVFAMSGPSVAHERICSRLMLALGIHIGRASPCQVFSGKIQLLIQRNASDICYHPDVVVDCRRDQWAAHFIRSPTLVIEVLSPSTQSIDRREKLQNYRRIESLEEYVIVGQNERKLTIHRRAEEWRPQVCAGTEAAVEFRSVGLTLPLDEIYGDIVGG